MATTPEYLILELYKQYNKQGHPKNIFIISDALPVVPAEEAINGFVHLTTAHVVTGDIQTKKRWMLVLNTKQSTTNNNLPDKRSDN